MLNIKRSNIQRCVATGEKNVRAVLHSLFVGEQFEVWLGIHATDGPSWRVYDAAKNTVVLSVQAPASIWELQDGTLVFIPESWWNTAHEFVQEIVSST